MKKKVRAEKKLAGSAAVIVVGKVVIMTVPIRRKKYLIPNF